jgi:hypothetical protein
MYKETNTPLTLADELAAQESERGIITAVIFAALGIALLLFLNAHPWIAALLLFVVVPIIVLHLFRRKKEWEYRAAIVAFKQQVLNLYVYAEHENDTSVYDRALTALDALEQADNKHGVKVWYMPYKSPLFFSFQRGKEGGVPAQGRHTVPMEALQSFEAYSAYVNDFHASDDYRRRLELYGTGNDISRTDWSAKFVLGQWHEN